MTALLCKAPIGGGDWTALYLAEYRVGYAGSPLIASRRPDVWAMEGLRFG